MNLTEAQHRAVYEQDKNLIVVAGAGSGKTRVLVERYLKLLEQNPAWPLNALVAITFTRKAAQEMRDRVRQALEDRLGMAATEAEQRVWADRLANMDSARIDTIHGLCATILRANAAEAGLDPDFAVLDEVEAAILLDTVIEDVLQQFVELDDPTIALFTDHDRRSVQAVLRTFAQQPLTPMPTDLFDRWQADWEAHAAEHIERLRTNADFEQALHWEPPVKWPNDDKLFPMWQLCWDSSDQLFTAEPVECLRLLRELNGAIKVNVGSQKNWGGKEALAEAKDCLRTIREVAGNTAVLIGDLPGALEAKAADMLPLWQRLIERVQVAYADAKLRDSHLDFDDLETYTQQLLNEHDAVRQRYRQGEFRHLLVDEFQDTNAAQWDIVQALADLERPGSLFVVGDQKQSIYAFRGADVSVFGAVRQRLIDLGGAAAKVALARSFRTHQPLVNGFNAIFERILRREADSAIGEYEIDLGEPMDAFRQEPPNQDPSLKLLLVNTTTAKDESRITTEEARRWEAYEIARYLHAQVEAETPVYDRDLNGTRPLRYDDVALLFQSTSQITVYEDVFKAQDLPFVTIAGRGYYNRQEVWDLLNLLRALYNPADNLSLASVLRSPLFGLSDDALLALRLVRDDAGQRLLLWDALNFPEVVPEDEQTLVAFACSCLNDLAMLAGRVTISELLREALKRTGYLAVLTGLPDGARRRGNVEKLLAKAASSGKITLGAFEQYLSDLSAREVREGEALLDVTGSVTLMTVHASKGLEYPLVVLVDSGWTRGNFGGPVVMADNEGRLCCKVYDPEADQMLATFSYRRADHLRQLRKEAERKRLLYVAATRAQDCLLVSGQITQDRGGAWSTSGWLDWLLDALDLKDNLSTSEEIKRDWGVVGVQLAEAMPSRDAFMVGEARRATAWDNLSAGQMLTASAQQPPLLQPVPVDQTAIARHLSVTQIADLGAHEFDSFYGERFRRDILHDAPAQVGSVDLRPGRNRIIGEIVHEVLRWWRPGTAASDLDALLESYAWEQGIINARERDEVIKEAHREIETFFDSKVYRWIASAVHIYRELPFIWDTGNRIVHGVIDILLQHPNGNWAIVDYKTSYLPKNATQVAADHHARRFHMQVGAYAAAVEAQLFGSQKVDADALAVYIHYIHSGLTVEIARQDWRTALDKMESYIGKLIGS